MKLTEKRQKQIREIYRGFSLYDLEYFLFMCAEKITVPVDRGDSVECQQGTFAKINGIYIDLITEEFEDAIEREKDKRINNLLNDKNE